MSIVKLPMMNKGEYDTLIQEEYMARVVFNGKRYPHIAPFLYIFNGGYMYFLSTKYGRKISHFKMNSHVSVEVERYAPDLSTYSFVTLRGRIIQVEDAAEQKEVLNEFIAMIQKRGLSKNILIALGYSPADLVEAIAGGERTYVWKLIGVRRIVGFRKQ